MEQETSSFNDHVEYKTSKFDHHVLSFSTLDPKF